jgi:hypothetical protein
MGELLQEAKEVPEGEPSPAHDPFRLMELEMVLGVHRVPPEDQVHAVHPERRTRMTGQVPHGGRGGLAPEHHPPGHRLLVRGLPSLRERCPLPGEGPALMGSRHAPEERVGEASSLQTGHRQHVMEGPGRMLLGHEQQVVVVELLFHDRTAVFLEAKAHQDLLHLP